MLILFYNYFLFIIIFTCKSTFAPGLMVKSGLGVYVRLQKPALECKGIVQLSPKCVKRHVSGEIKVYKDNILEDIMFI